MSRLTSYLLAAAIAMFGGAVQAITLDGTSIPSEGLPLLATQDSATQFGDATAGTQSSGGGSELNQLFAGISGGVLEMGITGNLQDNFNKMWIFFDAIDGGENILLSDNVDGGFNEIKAMEGLTFPSGVTPDHGIRLEIGGGFYGVQFFDLITNTSTLIATGAGVGDLPLAGVGGPKGVTMGWDNSNTLGVDGASAAGANTATTGFEFAIDLVSAFNGSQGDIKIVSFITSGDGNFASNQFLPGINNPANPGDPSNIDLTTVATVSGPVIGGALPGDVDGDGDVDLEELIGNGDGFSDFDFIRMNWLETNATFGSILTRGDGDLNENGEVGIEDFREWKNAFNGTAAQIAAAFASLGATTVPEPSTMLLVALGGAALLTVRRRSR